MATPMKDVSSESRSPQQTGASADSTLAELRESITTIAKEVAEIAERRTRAARETAVNAAETGVSELRSSIRRQPAIAMGVAVGAGALLALLVVPRFGRPTPRSRWESWTPNMPNITRADLYDMADNIQRSVSRAAGAAAAPVAPAFERMVEALSKTDTSTLNSIVEKMGGWFQKAQDKAKEKVR